MAAASWDSIYRFICGFVVVVFFFFLDKRQISRRILPGLSCLCLSLDGLPLFQGHQEPLKPDSLQRYPGEILELKGYFTMHVS